MVLRTAQSQLLLQALLQWLHLLLMTIPLRASLQAMAAMAATAAAAVASRVAG
jgi:hypothetical protein